MKKSKEELEKEKEEERIMKRDLEEISGLVKAGLLSKGFNMFLGTIISLWTALKILFDEH